MDIIETKKGSLKDLIRPIDESIILELAKIALECNKDTNAKEIRKKLYTSQYSFKNLEQKENELEDFLEPFQTEDQGKYYKWIKIFNANQIRGVVGRFYIAPNPNNMHEMIKKLVEAFSDKKTPLSVEFKYQLSTGGKEYDCDRIIIYFDEFNKDKIESAIRRVYQENEHLFKGCERSIAWVYDTSIPGVYSAAENPDDAYSIIISEAILEAKRAFNFLYGMTNRNSGKILNGKDVEQALEDMKLLITSIMLRKGILLSNDGICITITDHHVKSSYDPETGILTHFNRDERGYFKVNFFPTAERRNLLFKNFYSVSNIQPQNGLEIWNTQLGKPRR